MAKTFTTQDVAAHNKPNDLYIVVDEDVYDLTQFQDEHPGMYSSSLGSPLLIHNLPSIPHLPEADNVSLQVERRSSPA